MADNLPADFYERALMEQFTPISLAGLRARFLQTVTSVFNEEVASKSYAFKAEIKQIRNRPYNGLYYVQLQDTDVTISAMIPEEMVLSMNEGDSGIFCGVFVTRTSGDQAARFDTMLFRVTFFQRHGVGELYEAKVNLRERLKNEGLLAREPKPFPTLQNSQIRVVIVSNQKAKGYTDITSLLRPHPAVGISIKSCNLMDPEDIVRAIEDADNIRADVLIVARGGGDGLGIFDREEVVRAIAQCDTYTIAAIGHAEDTTLANEVSDYAVNTPTMAATYILDRLREYEVKRDREMQAQEIRKQQELAEKRFKELLDNQRQLQKVLQDKDGELKSLREKLEKQQEEATKLLKVQQEELTKVQEQKVVANPEKDKVLETLTKEVSSVREQLAQVTKMLEQAEGDKKAAVERATQLEAQLREERRRVQTPAPVQTPVTRANRPRQKSGGMGGIGLWVVLALVGIALIVWALH